MEETEHILVWFIEILQEKTFSGTWNGVSTILAGFKKTCLLKHDKWKNLWFIQQVSPALAQISKHHTSAHAYAHTHTHTHFYQYKPHLQNFMVLKLKFYTSIIMCKSHIFNRKQSFMLLQAVILHKIWYFIFLVRESLLTPQN